MDLTLATLLARLADPVTIAVAIGVSLTVRPPWGVLLAAVAASIVTDAVLAMMQPGRPLMGFVLIGGALAGLAWALAARGVRKLARRH